MTTTRRINTRRTSILTIRMNRNNIKQNQRNNSTKHRKKQKNDKNHEHNNKKKEQTHTKNTNEIQTTCGNHEEAEDE